MPTGSLITPHPSLLSPSDRLEADILSHIDEDTAIGLDALIAFLPQYNWSQIFHTIDRLARTGRIVLRRHRFNYTIFSKHFAD